MGAFSLPTSGPSQRDPKSLQNPYLLEIDAAANNAHAQLSPGAQEVMRRAGAPIPQAAAQPETPRITNPKPSMAMPLPGGVRGNAGNNFNTSLAPGEDAQYQSWKSAYAPHDSGEDYDLQGAYKYGLSPDPQTGHWSDRFKKPNEPTFSNESQYAQDVPEKAGSWGGPNRDVYVPPKGGITNPRPAPPSIAPVPLSPAGQAQSSELARITAPPPSDPSLIHTHANTGTSGVNQIHNPWARIPLQIAQAVGAGFAPGLTQAIPGTDLHHRMLVGETEGALKQQQGIRKGEEEAQTVASEQGLRDAQVENLGGEQPLHEAQTNEANARAWSLLNPKDKEAELNEFRLWHQQNPDAPVSEYLKLQADLKPQTIQEGERPLGERVPQLNQAMTSRYQVLHPKVALPPQFTIPPNATQKDYDRIDKALESEERAIGTKEQQAQTNEMRRQTMALAAANSQNRQETAIRTAGFKAYTPALDSAERFNVMTKNYEDAVRSHDQQAMLSLLANHLGMTMGLQKGARLTKDIIHEAENSRPWLQGLQAKFDKDGYLAGVNLTPQQMSQMINLGRERFSEDVTKGHSEAAYQGVQDQGPARIPNRSTINYYTALANGDAKKAKELAVADGWTVQ